MEARAAWPSWAVALAVGALHYWEVSCYHHGLNSLSVAEQKVVALKTENAFYYSYYEETVEAPTASAAFLQALHDRRSEAPDTINAIHRFNIYQELLCGLLFRVVRWAAPQWAPDPWYFFRFCSYALQGLGHLALVRLVAGAGGDGLLGGVLPGLSLAMLLFLHRKDISRIHDVGMLNLRENWAMPVILCQVLALQRVLVLHPGLRGSKASWRGWIWAFRVLTVACLVLWQFSAFAFLLQVSAVFLCALLSCSQGAREALADVVTSHLGCAAVAAALLCGNELLLHHMLVTQCAAIWAVLRLRRNPPKRRFFFWVDGVLAVGGFLVMRVIQSRWATAEEHIGEIFAAKLKQVYPERFAAEPTFNARLYLAVSVFDFIDWPTIVAALPTKVYHAAGVGSLIWTCGFFSRACGGSEGAERAEAFGNGVLLVQTVLFLALGCFISRLKVLGAPLLCGLAALAAAPRPLMLIVGSVPRNLRLALFAMAALVQVAQLTLLAKRLPFLEGRGFDTHREAAWPDGDQGELYDWMVRHLPPDEIIITSMPLSAELRLNTPFRVAIHPQFEARSLRDRVQDVYQFYQCTPPEAMAQTMRAYGSTIIVLEYKRCDFSPFLLDNHPELNCKKDERPWRDLFCPAAHASPHFSLLFANAGFSVLRARAKPVGSAGKLENLQVWRPMLESCLAEAPKRCASRIADLASMFHAKLGQHQIARTLHGWVREHAADNGEAQYSLGRHLDYELGRTADAGGHYRKAYELAPNNPLIVREYLMWLDLEAQDNRTLESMLRPRRSSRGERQSLLQLEDVALACEASVPAFELFRDLDWAEELWELATQRGIGNSCVKNNWPLHNGGRSMEEDLHPWGLFVNIFWRRGLRSELISANSNGVRYQPPREPWMLGLGRSGS